MDTLGSAPKTIVSYQEHGTIDLGFTCDAQVDAGTAVNLKTGSDGVVEIANAATDLPLGMVSVGNRAADERVTVKTPFEAVVAAKASGSIAHGGLVYQKAITSKRIIVEALPLTPAGVAHVVYAVGIALNAASNNGEVTIGVLRTPLAFYVLAGA